MRTGSKYIADPRILGLGLRSTTRSSLLTFPSARRGTATSGRLGTSLHEPRAPRSVADPYFRCDTPCTLLIHEIEAIWSAIAVADEWGPLQAKVAEIRAMGAALALPRRL